MPTSRLPSGTRHGVSSSATPTHVAHNRHEGAEATHAIQARLEKVSNLWELSVPAREIARQVGVGRDQVLLDIATIRAQIAADRIATLHERITESVAKLLLVQREAWQSYYALSAPGVMGAKDKDKAALLNVVMEAQDRINKLEGTDAPERVHAAAVAEVWQVMMDAAALAGGPEFQQYLLGMVQQRMGGSMSGQALGIGVPDIVDVESGESEQEENNCDPESADDAHDDEDISYTDEDDYSDRDE